MVSGAFKAKFRGIHRRADRNPGDGSQFHPWSTRKAVLDI